MSLDIIVKLTQIMGVSLDDFLLESWDERMIAAIYDEVRLRDVLIEVVDVEMKSDSGHTEIVLRVFHDRVTDFIEEQFSITLLNVQQKEIPAEIIILSNGDASKYNGSSHNLLRSHYYLITFRSLHVLHQLWIRYAGIVKSFQVDSHELELLANGSHYNLSDYKDADIHRMFSFFVKSMKIDRLLKFWNLYFKNNS